MSKNNKNLVLLASFIIASAVPLALSGCVPRKQDAWSVTYEIASEGTDAVALTDVTFMDQEMRSEAPYVNRAGGEATQEDPSRPEMMVWRQEAMLSTGEHASLSAKVPEGVRATCRILLDGEKEIATNTVDVGGVLTCEADTPQFGG